MNEPRNEPAAVRASNGRRPLPRLRLTLAKENRWTGPFTSTMLHGALLLLLFWPATNLVEEIKSEGAGGLGPAGGGGGGMRGTGGIREERVQFFVAVPRVIPPVVPPKVEEKKPEPVVPPPEVKPPEVPVDSAVKVTASTDITSNTAGTGGGTGNDGSSGNGSGSGGGRGSGIGDGVGSSVGSGTGGGLGTRYPATVTTMVILPLPAPSKVKPYEMVAKFAVNSDGNAILIDWTRSKDANYNKKVEASLRGYRFRPAVLVDGTAVVDTVTIKAAIR